MKKKNIDELFREKFKDFGEVPDERVWNSISASLDRQKKSRKGVIPIWWKLGGVAALLALMFYIINPFGQGEADTPAVTDVENATQDAPKSPLQENPLTSSEVEETDDPTATTDDKGNESTPATSPLNSAVNDPALASEQNGQQNDAPEPATVIKGQDNESPLNQGVAQVDTKSPDEQTAQQIRNAELTDTEKDTELAAVAVVDQKEVQAKETDAEAIVPADSKEIARNQEVMPGKEAEQNQETEEAVALDDSKKKSIFDEIQQEDQEAIAESKESKWSVGPTVAPVYFDSFGEGSPIHSNFVANSKSGNINLSYGLSVTYELSKKLSVRSGIHKVDYGYDTNDVSFTSSLSASANTQINNIDYTRSSKNLVVESSASGQPSAEFALNSAEVAALDPSRDGIMVQQFGYLEVPLELNYALVDKKFGVNVIGGVSSLFLVDNSVSLEADGGSTQMGEANNINSLNFSTNIGFGLNYQVSPKMQVNVEPMFKYQLNTFSDSAGNFQPFTVGVYSGVNLKF
ncbi:outer membrane beta-barrel protein [Poritiphilus flavus]|uniref:Outer membrane beta-barrel protein n=1 Tax=Poritiphilus flavus TaxID=2697053 RepID=A0A6L9E8I7_9FLAO|nr:outer membrane beta-barrel protein [Poritiphilus flavus]NAS10921.1 outer membrane beta-barrel protein [Poritiphilus flavus]